MNKEFIYARIPRALMQDVHDVARATEVGIEEYIVIAVEEKLKRDGDLDSIREHRKNPYR